MKVYLDGEVYHLQAGTNVTRSPLAEWPDNIRLDGQQKRKDRRWLSSWAIDRWSQGLGKERMNVDVASQLYRLWDAENVDTRHDFGIVLSPAFNTCTIVPSRGDLNIPLPHLTQLYFVETSRFESGYAASTNQQPISMSPAYVYQFSPPFTLGSNSRLGLAYGSTTIGNLNIVGSLSACKAFGKDIGIVVWTGDEVDVRGNRWFKLGGIGSLTQPNYIKEGLSLGTYPFGILGQLGDFGGSVHILEYYRTEQQVGFWVLNNNLGSLTQVATIGSVIGSYLAPLVTDGLTMFAQLPEGVYDFDATPSVIVDTSRAKDQNCMQTIFRQDLYFKNKKSLNKRLQDGSDVVGVGYDLEDGLPGDKLGEITAMTSSWRYKFCAIKGATYSHILTSDENNYWQYYARIPSAGLWVREMFLSDSPDAIDRLWIIYGNYGYPGYFLNPMANPLQAGTYSYVPTGHFTPPIFDGGMAEESGGFYDMGISADGMGGANTITALYGLNGANPVTTLGVTATNSLPLTFGSPYGIEGYRIQPRFLLSGANTGTTPIFRDAILHYLKIPEEREMFDFTLDLERTAMSEVRPLEAVIGSLNYIRDRRTLLPFWYGQIATRVVRILEMPVQETITEDKIYEGERSGIVRLRAAEIL